MISKQLFFPANKNRNRFAEPTSVQIGLGIVCESQNLRMWIGIIFVRWEVLANYSQIPELFFLSHSSHNFFFLTLKYFFSFKNLPDKENHSEIYAYFLYIFLIKIRYSWILLKLFVIKIIIHQIKIFANRNNIHEMKWWQIWIGIHSWLKYQQIDLWQIYFQTICKLIANT